MHPERAFALKISKYLSDATYVLDAGSGSGSFGNVITEILSNIKLIGIDIGNLKKINNLVFLRMNVEFLGFQQSSFDCILAKDIIEHLIFPLEAMKEFNRVLNHKGKLIISTPSDKASFLWDDYTHVRPFTKKSLRKLLEDSNFKVIAIGYLATSTKGASFLKINYLLDLLAKIGIRRGNVWAIGQKK